MKIGDKIRRVLAENPAIQKRRAQINAIGYLFKHNNKIKLIWSTDPSNSDTCLLMTLRCYGDNLLESISENTHMKSLSEYKQVGDDYEFISTFVTDEPA